MSLFRKLFGGGTSESSKAGVFGAIEYKGYTIQPEPIPEQGQFRLQAIVTKQVDGEERAHRLIRADMLPTADQAAEFAISKAKQMIDQQGERLFG